MVNKPASIVPARPWPASQAQHGHFNPCFFGVYNHVIKKKINKNNVTQGKCHQWIDCNPIRAYLHMHQFTYPHVIYPVSVCKPKQPMQTRPTKHLNQTSHNTTIPVRSCNKVDGDDEAPGRKDSGQERGQRGWGYKFSSEI